MIDKESFKEEISEKLHTLSRNRCLIFALRSALRVLPLLSIRPLNHDSKSAFWFWTEQQRSEHLLALFSAINYGIEGLINNSYTEEQMAKAYALSSKVEKIAHHNTNDHPVAIAVADAVSAAVYAIAANMEALTMSSVITNTSASNAAAVAYAVSFSSAMTIIDTFIGNTSNYTDILLQDIQQDLLNLDSLTEQQILQQALDTKNAPHAWQTLIDNFKTDLLALNAKFDIWLDWYNDRLTGKTIDVFLLNQWNDIPENISQQGVIAVNHYLKQLTQDTNLYALNHTRAFFIGDNNAGKTYLIEKLLKETYLEQHNETDDISIYQLQIPNTDITTYIWDFNKKIIDDDIQKIFLRPNCLYVLVTDDLAPDPTEQAERWLKQIEDHTHHAKVMLVSNKTEYLCNLNINYLKEKYDNIIGFYALSQQQTENFNYFQQHFWSALQNMNTNQLLCTREQLRLLKIINEDYQNDILLSQHEFIALCIKHKIHDHEARQHLLNILDTLGIIILLAPFEYLEDHYLLNTFWLSHGIFLLMDKHINSLTLKEGENIIHQTKLNMNNNFTYSVTESRLIINIMQHFNLCYLTANLLDEQNALLIIPKMLPVNTTEHIPFEKTDALTFTIEFSDFLTQQLMFEIIIRFYDEVFNGVVWQNGVLLKSDVYFSKALLELNTKKRTLSIWVHGKDELDYIKLLNYEITGIANKLNLHYNTWLYLPLATRITHQDLALEKVSYSQILAFIKKENWCYLTESNTEYDLKRLLSYYPVNNEANIEVQLGKFKTKVFAILTGIALLTLPTLLTEVSIDYDQDVFEHITYVLLTILIFYFLSQKLSDHPKNDKSNF